MESRNAASGEWGTVVWAVDKSGKSLAREYFRRLKASDRAKIQAVFNRLANFGRVQSQERFKKLGERNGFALWEVKSFQYRFIGTFSSRREFVVAHGLQKKQNQHRVRDLDIAAKNLTNYFEGVQP